MFHKKEMKNIHSDLLIALIHSFLYFFDGLDLEVLLLNVFSVFRRLTVKLQQFFGKVYVFQVCKLNTICH